MNNNPFADLIPTGGSNPFSDLIPNQKPRVPISGLTPEQDAEDWAEATARSPQAQPPASVSDAFWKAAGDPVGALSDSVSTIYSKLGGDPAWGNRLGRDVRDVIGSIGPLGVEFSGATGVARQGAKPPVMPKASVRSEAELLKTGGARMNEAKKSSEVVSAEDLQASLGEFNAGLRERNLRIHDRLHPTARTVYDEVELASRSPQTMEELHYLRQLTDDVAAKPGTEGMIGQRLKSAVDDMISKHPEASTFNIGKGEYARAKKSQIISQALESAKNSVLWDRGKQSAAIRHEIKKLLNNKQYKNFWTAEERAALHKAKGRTWTEIFGAMGSKNISGAAFGRMLEMAVGLPPGVLWGPGYLAREAANKASVGKMQAIGEQIRAGGPVAQKRLERVNALLSPKVFDEIAGKAEGARRIAAWVMKPSAQTARGLATYTAAKLGIPELGSRISVELKSAAEDQANQ